MNTRLLNAKQAALYLSISRALLYQLCSSGKIKSLRINTRRLFDRQDLDEFIENQKLQNEE